MDVPKQVRVGDWVHWSKLSKQDQFAYILNLANNHATITKELLELAKQLAPTKEV